MRWMNVIQRIRKKISQITKIDCFYFDKQNISGLLLQIICLKTSRKKIFLCAKKLFMSQYYESRNLMSSQSEKKQLGNIHSRQNLSNVVDSNQNSSQNYQSNKLPLNLFLTPAEYNKMLITNGKYRAKQVSRISEGYLSNLQFVNDSIFEKIQEEKQIARMSVKHQTKRTKKGYDQCTCCCCQEFCQQCSMKRQNCTKYSDMQKVMSQIDQEIVLAREGKKIMVSGLKQSVKKHIHSRRINSALSSDNKAKSTFIKSSQFQHPHIISQHNHDISHLVMKSLIDFQSSRKKQTFLKREKKQTQRAKQEYLKRLDAQIRSNNLRQSKSQRAIRKEVKSESKTKVSRDYWEKVKGEVMGNFKSDHYSGLLKEQLQNYKLNVYPHQEIPKKQLIMSKAQIEKLRLKHEAEAKKEVELKMKEKLQKKQRIEANLKSLQKQRILHIKATHQKPFKPTQEMINAAFKNIVQPNPINQGNNIQIASKPNRRASKQKGT